MAKTENEITIKALRREELRAIFTESGLIFRDEKLILDLGPAGTLAVDEDILLAPTKEGIGV